MASSYQIIFPIYAKEQLGITESRVGFILLIRALFSTICCILLGKSAYWHFRPKLIMVFQILLGAVLAIMVFVDSFTGYVLLMPAFGVIVAVTYSFSLFHGTSGSLERARRTAIHELVLSSGVMLGAISGGQIFQKYSMQTVYLFCQDVVAIAVVIQMFLLGRSAVFVSENTEKRIN